MNVARLLERSALDHGDRGALVVGDRRWTYRELEAQAATLAGGLAGSGSSPASASACTCPPGRSSCWPTTRPRRRGWCRSPSNVTYASEEIGPNVMKGYFGNAQATAEAIRDGWLRSGDIGYRDPDGYYYIVDRVKDMINVSGLKVFPREVEEVLFRHAAVKEAAVVGVLDAVRGETVKAFVVLHPQGRATADELRALRRGAVAAYKVPETIEFIDALPKNPTGKILKKELRRRG